HTHDADGNNSANSGIRRRRFANSRLSRAAVTEELRSRFLREIVDTAPEVLEKLRDNVLPEYIKAYNVARQPDVQAIVLFRWPPLLRDTVLSWAKAVRLLHKGKPPDWILAQVDVTL